MNARGMTLIELMTATVVAVVVMVAIGQVDVSRVRLSEEIRSSAAGAGESALAMAHLSRLVQETDRMVILNSLPGDVQLRRFTGNPGVPGALDNPANYQWAQYRFDAAQGAILLFDDTAGGCVESERFEVPGFSISFINSAPPPPGGDPFAPQTQDNNLVEVGVTPPYSNGVQMRSGAYTNVLTGLAPPGVSDPPPPC